MNARQRRELFSEIVAGVYLFVLFISEIYGNELLDRFREWKRLRNAVMRKDFKFKTGPVTFCKKKVNLVKIDSSEIIDSGRFKLVPRRFLPKITEEKKPLLIECADMPVPFKNLMKPKVIAKRRSNFPRTPVHRALVPDHSTLVESGSQRNYRIRAKRWLEDEMLVQDPDSRSDLLLKAKCIEQLQTWHVT